MLTTPALSESHFPGTQTWFDVAQQPNRECEECAGENPRSSGNEGHVNT